MILLVLINMSFAISIQDIFSVEMNPEGKYYDSSIQTNSDWHLASQNNIIEDMQVSNDFASNFNKDIFLTKKAEVLKDFDKRIDQNFHIPSSLKRRVGFWLDIYTKYDDNKAVIHDRDYPWVVYEVVDVEEQMKGKEHYWTRYHKAQRYIQQRKWYWSNLIEDLAKRRSRKNLSSDERKVLRHFTKAKYLKQASQRVRSQTGQKNHFEDGLERSAQHLSDIELIFSKKGLPFELTRLPLVESSFNLKAESKAGAKGIWQIMPSIGRKLGLFKGGKDLRSDVLASTEAAATLLKQKYRILDEWPLAVTAYNHGPMGVRNAVRQVGTTNITRIIRRYESRRFGFASQNFYASFLAALFAERYQEVFFHGLDQDILLSQSENNKKKEKIN